MSTILVKVELLLMIQMLLQVWFKNRRARHRQSARTLEIMKSRTSVSSRSDDSPPSPPSSSSDSTQVHSDPNSNFPDFKQELKTEFETLKLENADLELKPKLVNFPQGPQNYSGCQNYGPGVPWWQTSKCTSSHRKNKWTSKSLKILAPLLTWGSDYGLCSKQYLSDWQYPPYYGYPSMNPATLYPGPNCSLNHPVYPRQFYPHSWFETVVYKFRKKWSLCLLVFQLLILSGR